MPSSRRSTLLSNRATAPDDAIGPTPETKAKLRHDVLHRLAREGRLDAQHIMAAEEIRGAWEAIGRGLFPTARQLHMPRLPTASRAYLQPFERMSNTEERTWRLRYRPWADEMSIEIVSPTTRTTRLQLVHDVIIDNFGLRAIEDLYRLKHGRALLHIRAALDRYCQFAGWS